MLKIIPYLIDKVFIKNPKLRARVTRLLYGSKDRDIELFGTVVRVNAVRENGYVRAYEKSRRNGLFREEIGPLMALVGLLRPGDTFVDVGANIGLFCCTLARFKSWYPDLEIIAFEPHPDTFQRLKWNADRTGVVAHACALSDEEGELTFSDSAMSNVFAIDSPANPYRIVGKTIQIPTKRLDQVIPDARSVILKIDAEGCEHKVLLGASGLFDRGVVKAVFVDSIPGGEPEARQFLVNRGFTLWDARTLSKEIPGEAIIALKGNGDLSTLTK